MPIAVYEFAPEQATDLTTTSGSVVEVLDGLTGIVSVTSYVMAGNLYVVVAT
jgi:hypothetical protein